MSCFPSGPLPKRDPELVGPDGRSLKTAPLSVGIAAHDALVQSARTLLHPDPLVTLTDDPPRADVSLAWKYAHGSFSDGGYEWFADPDPKIGESR